MSAIIKQYTFGGLTYRVETPIPMREEARFEAFSSEAGAEPDYCLYVKPFRLDQVPDSTWPVIMERSGHGITVYMNTALLPEITVANLFVSARIANLLPERNEFLLHASYIVHEGKAILFSAPSGTGKSTQARFWERVRGSTVVNEDRVLIFKQNNTYMAGGAWATGSARLTANVSVPIRAIVLLGQAPENRVIPCKPSQALGRLLIQCSYDETNRESVDRMLTLLIDLLSHVPVLAYDCVNDPSAVKDLEDFL